MLGKICAEICWQTLCRWVRETSTIAVFCALVTTPPKCHSSLDSLITGMYEETLPSSSSFVYYPLWVSCGFEPNMIYPVLGQLEWYEGFSKVYHRASCGNWSVSVKMIDSPKFLPNIECLYNMLTDILNIKQTEPRSQPIKVCRYILVYIWKETPVQEQSGLTSTDMARSNNDNHFSIEGKKSSGANEMPVAYQLALTTQRKRLKWRN